jgi:prepilin-type processing-associated H-X9-DG protein
VKICRRNAGRFAQSRGRSGVNPSHRPIGFSLLEMLITLALMLVIFVLLFSFGSSSHQQRQKQSCQRNLQTIYLALQIFANDHDAAFPAQAGAQTSEGPLSLLVPRYTVDTSPFVCPGSKDRTLPSGEPFAQRRISYAYFMGRTSSDNTDVLMTDRQINTQPKSKGEAVFSTTGKAPGNNHHKYGGNYLFVDGHADMSSALAPFALVWTQNVVLLNPKP